MGNILSFPNKNTESSTLDLLSKEFQTIRTMSLRYLEAAGPDPLVEVFVNLIDRREQLELKFKLGCNLINYIELTPKMATGQLVFEQFCIPCVPFTVSSDIHPMDLTEFKKQALKGLSPRFFLKRFSQSNYYPLLEGVFFLDNPDYLYQGKEVKDNKVIFVGVQLSTLKTIKITFTQHAMNLLNAYSGKVSL